MTGGVKGDDPLRFLGALWITDVCFLIFSTGFGALENVSPRILSVQFLASVQLWTQAGKIVGLYDLVWWWASPSLVPCPPPPNSQVNTFPFSVLLLRARIPLQHSTSSRPFQTHTCKHHNIYNQHVSTPAAPLMWGRGQEHCWMPIGELYAYNVRFSPTWDFLEGWRQSLNLSLLHFNHSDAEE